MARALIGYVGAPAIDQTYEMAQLRRRITDLEAEVRRLMTENDALELALHERLSDIDPSELLEPVSS